MNGKTLNQQIAEALGYTSGALDYEHSVDAVLAELPRGEVDLLIWRRNGSDAYVVAITKGVVHLPNMSWVGKSDDSEQQAAARALLAYAEWKREQGA